MKAIPFDNRSAQRVYEDYMQRCRRSTAILSATDREDVLLEINSHIYEYLSDNAASDQMENLLNVLERLGAPEETLKEVVAAKKIAQATRTLNPKHLIQALALNLTKGVFYVIATFLFVSEICFPVLIFLKLKNPDRAGFFIDNNGRFLYGYLHQGITLGINFGFSTIIPEREILGMWFIPVTAVLWVLFFMGTLFLLHVGRKTKNR